MTAESAGTQPLIAKRTAIGPWEEFDLLAQRRCSDRIASTGRGVVIYAVADR